jgi:hypothetical protein
MKIVKTALVSTISLGIAMSTAALSAGPSLAQQAVQRAHLPVLGKQTCLTTALTFLTAGMPVDTGLGITFTLGAAKPVQLLFSTEIAFIAVTAIKLDYSIDGATPPIAIGPEGLVVLASVGPETRTAYAVTATLPKGKHTITPFLTSSAAAAATVGSRCFAVLNTGL